MELGNQFGNVEHQYVAPAGSDKRARLQAHHEGRVVSEVSWYPGSNTIHSAWTDENYQKNGLASGLVREIAQNHMPTYPNGRQAQLNHSTNRSPAGDALAHRTADFTYVPRNVNAPRGQRYIDPGLG
jgi:hypothetical protein